MKSEWPHPQNTNSFDQSAGTTGRSSIDACMGTQRRTSAGQEPLAEGLYISVKGLLLGATISCAAVPTSLPRSSAGLEATCGRRRTFDGGRARTVVARRGGGSGTAEAPSPPAIDHRAGPL